MSKLVIVESPAKAKTIQKYLGGGYAVLPTIGHIRELPKKDAIDPGNGYSMKYIVSPGKEDAVKKIKDHYFHKAKKDGYAARSAYKIEEIDKNDSLSVNDQMPILELIYRYICVES